MVALINGRGLLEVHNVDHELVHYDEVPDVLDSLIAFHDTEELRDHDNSLEALHRLIDIVIPAQVDVKQPDDIAHN